PAPSAETSSRDRGSKTAPRCGAAARPPLLRDSASTVASLVGSSLPSAARHRPHAAPRSAPVTALPPSPPPACSSLSAPSCPPQEGQLKGTFLSRRKGDIITEVQQPADGLKKYYPKWVATQRIS